MDSVKVLTKTLKKAVRVLGWKGKKAIKIQANSDQVSSGLPLDRQEETLLPQEAATSSRTLLAVRKISRTMGEYIVCEMLTLWSDDFYCYLFERKITKTTKKKQFNTQITTKHLPRKGELPRIITLLLQHLGWIFFLYFLSHAHLMARIFFVSLLVHVGFTARLFLNHT